MLKKIIQYLLILFLFLLPWQTRFVYEPRFLNSGFWEYGSGSWYATEILLWIIIILSAIDLFRQKEFWQRVKAGQGNKRNVAIGILVIGYLILEIFHSLSPSVSFNFVFRLIGAACLCVMLMRTANPHPPSLSPGERGNVSSLLFAFWLGGVVQGLLACWQFFTQSISHLPFSGIAPHTAQELGTFVIEVGDQRWLRAYGSFGSPNILGGFLAIIFLVGLIVYLKTPPSWKRVGLIVSQLFVTAGLLLSFSRAAWITVVVGIITLLVVMRRNKTPSCALPLTTAIEAGSRCGGIGVGEPHENVALPNKGRDEGGGLVRPLLFSAAVVVVLFLALKPLFLVRTESLGRLEHMSLASRIQQYHNFKKIITTHPLLGVGPGAYTYALYSENKKLPVWQYQPIHNIYLLILAELGIIGLIVATALLSYCATALWKHNRFFLPILISIFILGLFDHWLWSMYVGHIMGTVVLAMTLSSTLLHQPRSVLE